MTKPTRFFLLFFSLLLLHGLTLRAQSGCTDPQAVNYDPAASANDGSCEYPPTSYSLQYLTDLPDKLVESSALAFFSGGLWSLNDTNNPNEIYRIDTLTGDILHNVVLRNFGNIDWEEMAEDSLYLYVGDFGNNVGNRTDLRVLRIRKSDLTEDSVDVDEIRFQFSDQTDFSARPNNHNFDCEAFISYKDSLHLFTKNWEDQQSRYYTLSREPGDHIARLKRGFDADGLITAADINEQGVLVLLGYKGLNNFLWLFFDYSDNHFFAGNKRRIELGLVFENGQTEGLAFDKRSGGYISAERISEFGVVIPQRLFRFRVDQWTETKPLGSQYMPLPIPIRVGPNPFRDQIVLQLAPQAGDEEIELRLTNELGQSNEILFPKGQSYEKISLDLTSLPDGVYYLSVMQGKNHWVEKIIKNAE